MRLLQAFMEMAEKHNFLLLAKQVNFMYITVSHHAHGNVYFENHVQISAFCIKRTSLLNPIFL